MTACAVVHIFEARFVLFGDGSILIGFDRSLQMQGYSFLIINSHCEITSHRIYDSSTLITYTK